MKINTLIFALILIQCISCQSKAQPGLEKMGIETAEFRGEKIEKTDEEWEFELSPESYETLRNEATERPYSSPYLKLDEDGIYHCGACLLPLFASETKYECPSGWPSFYEPIDPSHIVYVEDNSHGMKRVEIECARCGSHLGHVFDDGPQPTGLRYCTNGAALQFDEKKEE